MKSDILLVAISATFLVALPSYAQKTRHAPAPQPLEVEMFYQFSATDQDAEVTIGIESPDHPIAFLAIIGPDGRRVATVRSADKIGLAEVELESAEPSVQEVQQAYPEGSYVFVGKSIDGAKLFGRAEITHNVIAAPDFFMFSPCDGTVDAGSSVSIAWNSVEGATGYEIIIEQDDTGANLRVTQSSDRTGFVIPDGFLASGLEYEIEMKSVMNEGNKTSASCEFETL